MSYAFRILIYYLQLSEFISATKPIAHAKQAFLFELQ